jgi:antirestriction protein ArdC
MQREDVQERATAAFEELALALEQGDSAQFLKFLDFQSRFHRYSFGNSLLIMFQRPDATQVAGFHRWKELGRFVKKGEQGIAILAPLVSRVKPSADDSEAEATSESALPPPPRKVLRGFKVVHVFDVSQTDGAPLPEFAGITGEPGDKLATLEIVVRSYGIELLYEQPMSGALGVSEGGRIRVQPDLVIAEKFSVLAHELAHELLHRGERRAETTKTMRETEAEAVAFVVCRASGIDSTERSRDYIRLYNGDRELLMDSLEHIQKVSTAILSALEDLPTQHSPPAVDSADAKRVLATA